MAKELFEQGVVRRSRLGHEFLWRCENGEIMPVFHAVDKGGRDQMSGIRNQESGIRKIMRLPCPPRKRMSKKTGNALQSVFSPTMTKRAA
jgi:hypothetical protein